MKKRGLYYVSPCTILGAIVLIMILVGIIEALFKGGMEGLGGIAMIALVVIFIVSLVTATIARAVTNERIFFTWVIEGTVIGALLFLFAQL